MDADDRFDVVLLGFAAGQPETPTAGLKRVFGIDETTAVRLLGGLPRTVQKNVARVRAEYFRRALASIGGDIEIRARDGHVVLADEQAREQADPLGSGARVLPSPEPAAASALRAPTIVQAQAPAAASTGGDFASTIRDPAHPTLRQDAAQAEAPSAPAPASDVAPSAPFVEGLARPIEAQAPSLDAPASPGTPFLPGDAIDEDAPYPTNAPTIQKGAPSPTKAPAIDEDAPYPTAAPTVVSKRGPGGAATPGSAETRVRPAILGATLREPPAPRLVPRTAAVAAPAARLPVAGPGPASAHLDTRSFWSTFVEALAVPFRGNAIYWLVAITVWSIVVGLFGALAGFFPLPIVGFIIAFFAQTSLIAFACDFFKVCMWVPTTGEETVDRPPQLDPEKLLHTYVVSGLHLSIFSILSMIPLLWWIVHNISFAMLTDWNELLALALHPVTWLLFVLPGIYWPIGVALTALGNNFAAIWNVPLGFRALSRAPLELLAIVAVGLVAFFGSWILMALFGSSLGLPGFLLQSSNGLPLAASHGMMGALFGHLVRSRPDLLD